MNQLDKALASIKKNTERLNKGDEDKVAERKELTYRAEQTDLFNAMHLNPGREIPTLLARLPIFPAIRKRNQKPLLDEDNGYCFDTVFGSGRRLGPPVDTDDEDRLFALMRLRNKMLIGEGTALPCPINSEGKTKVHYTECSIKQINEELGLTDTGPNRDNTLKSIKRLAAVSVEINVRTHDRYFGKRERGTNYRLVDVCWDVFDLDGMIRVQFPPLIAQWLENSRTFLNWDQRRQLNSRNVKALHRYISTQGREHEKRLDLVAEIIGWEGERRRIKQSFEKMLNDLVEIGFLESYSLSQAKKRMPITMQVIKR